MVRHYSYLIQDNHASSPLAQQMGHGIEILRSCFSFRRGVVVVVIVTFFSVQLFGRNFSFFCRFFFHFGRLQCAVISSRNIFYIET